MTRRLESTVMRIESQMFVHWLLPHRVASVTSHLSVRHSLLVSLQVCYWLRVVQGVSNKLRSNCKVNFRVHVYSTHHKMYCLQHLKQSIKVRLKGLRLTVRKSSCCELKFTSTRWRKYVAFGALLTSYAVVIVSTPGECVLAAYECAQRGVTRGVRNDTPLYAHHGLAYGSEAESEMSDFVDKTITGPNFVNENVEVFVVMYRCLATSAEHVTVNNDLTETYEMTNYKTTRNSSFRTRPEPSTLATASCKEVPYWLGCRLAGELPGADWRAGRSSTGMKGRFLLAKIQIDPAGDRTRIALVGGEQANRSASAVQLRVSSIAPSVWVLRMPPSETLRTRPACWPRSRYLETCHTLSGSLSYIRFVAQQSEPRSDSSDYYTANSNYLEATVAKRLACSPPTKANRAQSPAASLRSFDVSNTKTWYEISPYEAGNAMTGAVLACIPVAMADLAQDFTESGIALVQLSPVSLRRCLTLDVQLHSRLKADVVHATGARTQCVRGHAGSTGGRQSSQDPGQWTSAKCRTVTIARETPSARTPTQPCAACRCVAGRSRRSTGVASWNEWMKRSRPGVALHRWGHAKFALFLGINLNFTVLCILGPASFLHWLQPTCEVTPFLSNLHVIGAHECEVFAYWRRVTRGVSKKNNGPMTNVLQRLDVTVVWRKMQKSPAHWLSAVTAEGNDWAGVLQKATNAVWTNGRSYINARVLHSSLYRNESGEFSSVEQRRNERVGETGDPRKNPPTKGIALHDSHMRKSGQAIHNFCNATIRRTYKATMHKPNGEATIRRIYKATMHKPNGEATIRRIYKATMHKPNGDATIRRTYKATMHKPNGEATILLRYRTTMIRGQTLEARDIKNHSTTKVHMIQSVLEYN
ncbi:hypothetical protein PR048_020592 [Dryococelus australis]|uniref:Uncharacterized protein n=1 Tax=Dryococelus australis TaxID=614101 RepID=A0ABQ9H6R8_9NEOP|nr:hypothetical protein PR048_020592 [Dryococelus australis]